jgi:hypothetical protein
MTRLPTPGSAKTPVIRASGGVTTRAPGVLKYDDVDAFGFDILPAQVRKKVVNLLSGSQIAATGQEPVTKRRPDGSHYQSVSGWWASASRVVLVTGRRELEPIANNCFRPRGRWHVSGHVHHFPPHLRPETSKWHFEAATSASKSGQERRTDDALDVLPPALAAPVIGGSSDAWKQGGPGSVEETIFAIRILEDRIRVLKAKRKARSERALAVADWHAWTLDAPVVASEPFGDSGLATRGAVGPGKTSDVLSRRAEHPES